MITFFFTTLLTMGPVASVVDALPINAITGLNAFSTKVELDKLHKKMGRIHKMEELFKEEIGIFDELAKELEHEGTETTESTASTPDSRNLREQNLLSLGTWGILKMFLPKPRPERLVIGNVPKKHVGEKLDTTLFKKAGEKAIQSHIKNINSTMAQFASNMRGAKNSPAGANATINSISQNHAKKNSTSRKLREQFFKAFQFIKNGFRSPKAPKEIVFEGELGKVNAFKKETTIKRLEEREQGYESLIQKLNSTLIDLISKIKETNTAAKDNATDVMNLLTEKTERNITHLENEPETNTTTIIKGEA